MLTRLRIDNFKSWKKADFEIAPLTVLFGANSSGKSSLIQFLLLLKQTRDSLGSNITLNFGDQESYANLGSYKDAIYFHDESRTLQWRLDWKQKDALQIVDPSGKRSKPVFEGHDLSLQCSVVFRNRQPICDDMLYRFGDEEIRLKKETDRSEYKLSAKAYKFIRTTGRPWDLPGPIKSYVFPDQTRTYYQNSQFLLDLASAYERQMDGIIHLGPLREPPRREYSWAGGTSPEDLGRRGERVIEAILSATAKEEKRNLQPKGRLRSFQEMIAYWLHEMGLIHSFRVEDVGGKNKETGLYRVYVKRDEASAETLITDVGFGVSQVLPVLVLLYYAPSGSTLLLEQPEIHLHPSVQAALADVVVNAVVHRKVQVIVESHSEHFLQRLTRRIAEKENSPYPSITEKEVKLYYCSMEKGVSHLSDLNINLFGDILNWPKDFFGDPFGETAARQMAALRRRKESQ